MTDRGKLTVSREKGRHNPGRSRRKGSASSGRPTRPDTERKREQPLSGADSAPAGPWAAGSHGRARGRKPLPARPRRSAELKLRFLPASVCTRAQACFLLPRSALRRTETPARLPRVRSPQRSASANTPAAHTAPGPGPARAPPRLGLHSRETARLRKKHSAGGELEAASRGGSSRLNPTGRSRRSAHTRAGGNRTEPPASPRMRSSSAPAARSPWRPAEGTG